MRASVDFTGECGDGARYTPRYPSGASVRSCSRFARTEPEYAAPFTVLTSQVPLSNDLYFQARISQPTHVHVGWWSHYTLNFHFFRCCHYMSSWFIPLNGKCSHGENQATQLSSVKKRKLKPSLSRLSREIHTNNINTRGTVCLLTSHDYIAKQISTKFSKGTDSILRLSFASQKNILKGVE